MALCTKTNLYQRSVQWWSFAIFWSKPKRWSFFSQSCIRWFSVLSLWSNKFNMSIKIREENRECKDMKISNDTFFCVAIHSNSTKRNELIINSLSGKSWLNFILHYVFCFSSLFCPEKKSLSLFSHFSGGLSISLSSIFLFCTFRVPSDRASVRERERLSNFVAIFSNNGIKNTMERKQK